MKKLVYIPISFWMIIVFSSCLDEKLYDKYTSDDFFTDVNRMDMAVLGCYASLQGNAVYGQNLFTAYDSDTDLQFAQGLAVPTTNYIRNIGHYYILPSETGVENTWKALYAGIRDANMVLANADRVPRESDEEQKKWESLVGEAKFLRALMYFELVRFWGDVPLVLDVPGVHSDMSVERTDRALVYDRIVKDLEEAYEALPWYDEMTAYVCRAHKSAAMGLLARVNLYRAGYSLHQDGTMRRPDNYKEHYEEVLKWTELLIESGKHKLNADYEQIFKNQCQFVLEPQECIFEIDLYFSSGKLSGGVMGYYNAPKVERGKYNETTARINTHHGFYLMFEEGDKRRKVSIGNFRTDKEGKQTEIKPASSETYGIGKWRREYQTEAQFSDLYTSINFVLLRYSDVLLMRAEALNEVNDGPTAEAVELVNQVRRRGYGLPVNTAVTEKDPESGYVDKKLTDFAGYETFLSFIQDERARELAFESAIRRTDLIRWNILADKIAETYHFVEAHRAGTDATEVYYGRNFRYVAYDYFVAGRHGLYPIPARERRENPKLLQNPGYSE